MLKRKITIFISFMIILSITIFIFNQITPSLVMEDNPFISTDSTPMLCAHRGGSINSPENTLKAYKDAVREYQADILETDLWMTKDGYLVLNHDGTLNRTSDIELFTDKNEEEFIIDYELEELKNLNFGYNFQINNTYPYRDLVTLDDTNRKEIIKENDLGIVTIDDLFNTFYETNKDLLFIVEIKNSGDIGYEAASILDDILTNKYKDYKKRVVIGTFHNEIEKDLKENHPSLLRGASTKVATKFILTQMFGVNILDYDNFTCLQIPPSMSVLDLTLDTYIKRAHKRNIAVQYWTINDQDMMKTLIRKQVDAIMTDDPKLLRETLNNYS